MLAAMASSGNDDDLTIPRAAINKMIKETLPNVRVANDARELVVNCCTEFIHLISSEANEICNKSDKKTISPEHVINGTCCIINFCTIRVLETTNLHDCFQHRSPGEPWLWLIHNRGERCAAGVQNCCFEKEESQFPSGKPGHSRRGAPPTAAGVICQGQNY